MCLWIAKFVQIGQLVERYMSISIFVSTKDPGSTCKYVSLVDLSLTSWRRDLVSKFTAILHTRELLEELTKKIRAQISSCQAAAGIKLHRIAQSKWIKNKIWLVNSALTCPIRSCCLSLSFFSSSICSLSSASRLRWAFFSFSRSRCRTLFTSFSVWYAEASSPS